MHAQEAILTWDSLLDENERQAVEAMAEAGSDDVEYSRS